jgi:ankyrin repeat protein
MEGLPLCYTNDPLHSPVSENHPVSRPTFMGLIIFIFSSSLVASSLQAEARVFDQTLLTVPCYGSVAMRKFIHRFRSSARNSTDDLNPGQPASLPSALDSRQRNPGITLHDAASKGLTQTARWRLTEGAAINALDSQGWTALHLAIREGHVETVELLLNWGADVEAIAGPSSTKPIHLAAMTLNPTMMTTLLKYRPNLESRSNGLTALYYAILAGDDRVVKLLLEAGADARARTLCEPGTGESVLHMAVGLFRHSMLRLLIRYGADVNVSGTNPAGQTALHMAAQYGNEEGLRELINSGANVFATFPDGKTALDIAAKAGHINTASILLDHGLDPLATHAGGITAVYVAAIHNKEKVLRFLLDRCAGAISEELKIKTVIGAAGAGRLEILKMLDARGFPIVRADHFGTSGLSAAAYFGHKDVVVYLLRQGANPRQRIDRETTSFDMAILGGHDDISKLLQDAERQRAANPDAELFPDWKYSRASNEDFASDQAEGMATIMSVNATRRIHANQEPPGIFVCNVCKDLDFRRGMAWEAEVVLFMTVALMHSAASRGCRGCQFLSDCLAQARTAYGEGLWGNGPTNHFVLHSATHGAPLLLHSYASIPTSLPSRRIEIYVKEGKYAITLLVRVGNITARFPLIYFRHRYNVVHGRNRSRCVIAWLVRRTRRDWAKFSSRMHHSTQALSVHNGSTAYESDLDRIKN